MEANVKVDADTPDLASLRARLETIRRTADTIQGVYAWFIPDRLAEDGTVLENGGPIAVLAVSRNGRNMRAHLVALCNTRATADAVAQYAAEFFALRGALRSD